MDDSEIPNQYAPHEVEETVGTHWAETDAYEAAKAAHEDDPSFFFVDGPPYTTGQMHLGTAWNKSLKDSVIRYKRMTGHDVTDRPGYDMHGLPIETKVEEELGFETKQDIESFGMEAFIEECRRFAEENREAMDEDFQSLGVWMDWDDPYKTITPEYMEAAWWAFAQVHDRGLVEQGKRSISQCPRCETAIANNEVEYHQVSKPSIYVKFPLADEEGSLVIWTTTPWTIVANTFVAVDADLTYQKVRAERDGDSEVLYVAADCVEEVLSRGRYEDFEVLAELSGEELAGTAYEHPLPEEVPDHVDAEGTQQVYTADYVEADRTGLVHSAPGHGEEDFERGQELGLPAFCPVGTDGVYTDEAGAYAGQFVRDANDDIVADLDDHGLLLASEDDHTVDEGQCWRCDTDIVRIVTDQWFVTVTDVKDELLANLEDSEWHPPEARDNRFRNFVENAPDWNVSRQRYWGIPLPIWVPTDEDRTAEGSYTADETLVVATREELAERVDQEIDPDEIDLHRPSVDNLTITEDGVTYERVPDVFDVWFDSSVASLGTIGYPEDEAAFEELWPADVILEAHDQTRGWFWSQLGMGTAALGQVPYEEVVMHGFARLGDGTEMSKSRGTVITPDEAIEEAGRDPLRCYLLSQEQHGDDLRFEWDGLAETQRTLNILWNVFRFPLEYMELDGYDPATASLDDGELTTVDEWVLSRLQTVEREVATAWADYHVDDALNAVLDFVTQDVSRFYVKATRERMWEDADSATKRGAYATMATVLDEVTRLLAPFAPYLTERMYQHLDGEATTVHALSYPEADETLRDSALESDVAVLRAAEEAAANARQQAERKLRWPVTEVVVESPDATVREAVERHADLFGERVNARTVTVAASYGELVDVAEAEMSELGPAFGGAAQDVMAAVNGASRDELTAEGGTLAVTVDGERYELTDEMVSFHTEAPEGVSGTRFTVSGAGPDGADVDGNVYVDTELTDDVESEGYARDVVRRVQEMRKELDLDVEERIVCAVDVADERVAGFVADHADYVAEEVRADDLRLGESLDRDPDLTEEWDVEGVAVTISVARVAAETPADD
ncbi:isoleucine--tRNA ligase [Halobaculum sp. MBLA0147]|uniref:isoleucine--tRNA ligase n=1 Tax=Halobaculum sp. MBLA0147 TaxID=3079934 RepID=UPI0035247029